MDVALSCLAWQFHRVGNTGINWELYLRNIALLHNIRIMRTVSEHARIAQK